MSNIGENLTSEELNDRFGLDHSTDRAVSEAD
jgi:hypothetical protein